MEVYVVLYSARNIGSICNDVHVMGVYQDWLTVKDVINHAIAITNDVYETDYKLVYQNDNTFVYQNKDNHTERTYRLYKRTIE